MQVQPVCEWNHCRQSFNARSDLARHYKSIHKGRRPDAVDLHKDAEEAFRHRIFWDGVAQRRRQAQRKRARGGRDSDDSADDSQDEDGDESGEEGEGKLPREFVHEEYPEAGWACDSQGRRLPTQFPPPVAQELLVDADDPFHPFEDKRAWRWAERAVIRRMTRSELAELAADHEEFVSFQTGSVDLIGGGAYPDFHQGGVRGSVQRHGASAGCD
ncbi:hypothetical protein P7C70_g7208, partial [Phenoliferia sp. Uapishka_3]